MHYAYDYDAFGNDRNELTADNNPFRYCGEYFDTATETYFLRARWYDPATGRFTQQDSWVYYKPDDPLSLNLYVYCAANPVTRIDPQGTSWKDFFAGIALAIDDYLMNGFSQLISGGKSYNAENEEHYYIGRAIGSAGSVVFGIVETVEGIKLTINSIKAGVVFSVGTGGGGAVVAYEACGAIAVVGVAEAGMGISIALEASKGFGEDLTSYTKVHRDNIEQFKKPASGKTAKEAARDVPSWAKGYRPYKYENGEQFATRVMDERYGSGNYEKVTNSEYSKIKKWGDRGFE